MTRGLYTVDVLRLAAGTSEHPRLADPHGSADRRTATCGSRITVDVALDDDRRVVAYGHRVSACALGQAAATVIGRAAVGRTARELDTLRCDMRAFLAGQRDTPPAIEGAAALSAVRSYPARHEAVLLAFEAAADATAVATRGASAAA